MNKLLKSLVALLLLLVAALVFAAYLVDPNDYKDDIQEGFAAATGHELVISGQVRITLFPKPVLEVTQASVPGAFGAQGPTLAEIELVRLYPRWAPLLEGRFELALVRVEGLRLYLIRDEQGRASWDTDQVSPALMGGMRTLGPWNLAEPSWSPGPFDALAAVADPASAPDWPSIGRVELLDAQVTWDDRGSGQWLELDGLDFWANPVIPDRPIAWRLTGSLHAGDGSHPAGLRAEGSLRVGRGPWPSRLEPLTVRVEGFSLGQGLATDLLLRTRIDADLDAGHYLADRADLEIRVFGAPLSKGRIEAKVGAHLDLDLNTERLQVTDLALRSGTLAATGTALGQRLLSAPVFTGDLEVKELDLRAWLEQQDLPLPQTADAETFRRFVLDTRWRLEEGRFGLSDLVLGVDETRVTGAIDQISISPQGSRFDLVADRLNLDSYLPPPLDGRASARAGEVSQQEAPVITSVATPAGSGKETVPTPAASDEISAVSASAPSSADSGMQVQQGPPSIASASEPTGSGAQARQGPLPSAPAPESSGVPATTGPGDNLDMEGRLRIGELVLARLRFGDADLRIRAKDERLHIDNQVRRFYEGVVAGRLTLDVKADAEPEITLVQHAERIRSGRLLTDLAGDDTLSGRGEISADLVATGRDLDALRRSLTGTLAIHFPQGTIKGINLEQLVREAKARLQGGTPPADLPRHTEFKDLRATAEIRDGVLSNQDLVATSDHLRVTGAGTLDLVRERIDYRLKPVFVEPPQGRGIKELEGVPIPVHLTGTFDHPHWDPDVGEALNTAAKRKLGEQGEDLFRALEERTGIKGLEEGLKDLLGR